MAASEAAYKLPFGFAKAAVQTKGANKSCTFTDTGDVVGVVGHGYTDGDRVVFSAITTTTGITINTYYYVRDATADTLRVLRDEGAAEVGGVLHCFTESWEVAEEALELGLYLSLSGIVTFKNAAQVKEVAAKVPLQRLLIETDAPYLAPVPYRGKLNQPAHVRYVAAEIARLRGLTEEAVGEATSANFRRLFKLDV